MKKCSLCEKEHGGDAVLDDSSVCDECIDSLQADDEIYHCDYHEKWHYACDMTYVASISTSVCQVELERRFGFCESCEEYFPMSDMSGDNVCDGCYDADDSRDDRHLRNANLHTTRFISEHTVGRTITSLRKFGVELELQCAGSLDVQVLSSDLSSAFGLVRDASIDDEGVEIISPRLGGFRGERALRQMFEAVQNEDLVAHESCGLHVHLNAPEFRAGDAVDLRVIPDDEGLEALLNNEGKTKLVNWGKNITVISKEIMRKLSRNLSVSQIIETLRYGGEHLTPTLQRACKTVTGQMVATKKRGGVNIVYYSLSPVNKPAVLVGDWVIEDNRIEKNLENLKRLLYLYTAYNDVFLSLLPERRRQSTEFAKNLPASYSYDLIPELKTFFELESFWYREQGFAKKAGRKADNYDRSRYHGVNLHNLFSDKGLGTVEVRWYDSTKNAQDVLYWIALHQAIMDNIAGGGLNIDSLAEGAGLYGVKRKRNYLLPLLQLRPSLEKYITSRAKRLRSAEDSD